MVTQCGMRITNKLDLLEHWRQKAQDERDIAKQYEWFANDRMFKLGIAQGIELCIEDLVKLDKTLLESHAGEPKNTSRS